MRDYVAEYPGASHLVGAYFHEDWSLHGHTPDEVVKFFVLMENAEARTRTVLDIDRLLQENASDDALTEALIEFGCAYNFQDFETSSRDWLERIRAIVAASLPGMSKN